MKIKIRSGPVRLTIPVPMAVMGLAVRWVPRLAFKEMERIEEPYRSLIGKEVLPVLLRECKGVAKENKGLKIIRVEAVDGTFVSVKL